MPRSPGSHEARPLRPSLSDHARSTSITFSWIADPKKGPHR
jgi:hypothetical protein